ncbi:hypothetical protein E3N88_16114 [Mikania micrantha]|uniref:Pentacotripeptide-repeat region of PRORP domain-containing protein n=1 Tax=Mikania micrantha TaxID=192012 RepID=A0A5N6NXJ3_9ASTR|nr:hypothetical protein E3N88_16114 [Mikania micrantha]
MTGQSGSVFAVPSHSPELSNQTTDAVGSEDMRRFSALASRAQQIPNQITPKFQNQSKIQHNSSLKHKNPSITSNFTARGKLSSINPQLNLPINKPIDHHYISQILSRKDWYLLLNNELKANKFSLNPRIIVSILQNQENPLHKLVFYLWVSNINPLFAKNQSVRRVLANTLYRKGPVLLTKEFIDIVRSSGCSVTEDLLCVLISSWGRLGLAKYCAQVFDQISLLGLDPSTRLYNAVIDALVKSNALDLAYLKFQQMKADRCNPDRFTYNFLIHGVCKVGVVDEALRLMKQMQEIGYTPNVFTYTILIDGYCNAKRIKEAFSVLERMKESNVKPNDATFRSLVNGVFHNTQPLDALKLLSDFVEKEHVLHVAACGSVLLCLSRNSMSQEIGLFLKKIIKRGYIPDTMTLNITITCLLKGFDLMETCDIVNGLIVKGVNLGFNAYIRIVESLYMNGKPNAITYNILIRALCINGDISKAKALLKSMQVSGPTSQFLSTLSQEAYQGQTKQGSMLKFYEALQLFMVG